MPLSSVKGDTTTRFVELQQLLRVIFANEGQRPTPIENQTLKGLFVVGLYAYTEFSLGSIISSSISHINKAKVQHRHLTSSLYTMVAEPNFMAASELKGEKKWNKRRDILRFQTIVDTCEISDHVLMKDIQNVRFSTIELTCNLFAIKASPAVNIPTTAYINEVSERRNAVAHGRESPAEVGRRYTAATLETRLTCINLQFTHLIMQFEEMINKKHYLKPACRRFYP